MHKVTIDNVELILSHPLKTDAEWIGQAESMEQLLACWLLVSEKDLPLTPRIIGHRESGKLPSLLQQQKSANRMFM